MTDSDATTVMDARTIDERHPPSLLALDGGGHVAYRHLGGREPTVVFLCGYASNMSGTKARFLHRVCAEAGHAYLRFDYRGHGASAFASHTRLRPSPCAGP